LLPLFAKKVALGMPNQDIPWPARIGRQNRVHLQMVFVGIIGRFQVARPGIMPKVAERAPHNARAFTDNQHAH
jgi:hypothetical protein